MTQNQPQTQLKQLQQQLSQFSLSQQQTPQNMDANVNSNMQSQQHQQTVTSATTTDTTTITITIMVQSIFNAYRGRVTIEQIMQMSDANIEALYNELLSRLSQWQQSQNQNQQQEQRQTHSQQNQRQASGTGQDMLTNSKPTQHQMLCNQRNPLEIVLVLLHQYPQMGRWLQTLNKYTTVTASDRHANQFLTELMNRKPEFSTLVEIIQEILQRRRQAFPNQDAVVRLQLKHLEMKPQFHSQAFGDITMERN